MSVIMAGIDHRTVYPVVVLRVVSWSRQCCTLFGDSTGAAHHHGHLHPRRGAEASPMAQSIQQTIEIPLLPGSASSSGAGMEKTAVSHIALVRGCRRGEHV